MEVNVLFESRHRISQSPGMILAIIAAGLLLVVPADAAEGEPSPTATWVTVERANGVANPSNFEVEPGEVQVGKVEWSANWFYEDAPFSKPGRYEIALELIGDPEEPEPITLFVGTVRTSSLEPRSNDFPIPRPIRTSS